MAFLSKLLQVLPLILSAISAIWRLFKKPVTPIEVKKEENKIKEDVKNGDIDKLNEQLGWKKKD